MLGQPTTIWNFAKIIVLSMTIMGGLLAFIATVTGGTREIVPLPQSTATCAAVVAALLLFVIVVVFRNRMAML